MVRLFIICVLITSAHAALAQELSPKIAQKLQDLPGTYNGKLPCADCSGIACSITLQCDSLCTHGRYMRIDKYMGTKNGDQTNKIKGNWSFLEKNNATEKGVIIIRLENEESVPVDFYEVTKKGDLLPVDKDLKKIDAPIDMTLKKL